MKQAQTLTANIPSPPATEMLMVAATGKRALALPESLLCSFVVVVPEPLEETASPELAPTAAVGVAVGSGSNPCGSWIEEVLGATSSAPVAELSVEITCVPLGVAEAELLDAEAVDTEVVDAEVVGAELVVFTGCVDDGDVCAEVDVAAARSVLCQLIWIIGANSVMVATSSDLDPSDMVRTPVLGSPRRGQLSVETVPVETTWEHVCPPLLPQV